MKSLRDFAVQDEVPRRTEVMWALATLVVVVALVAVTTLLYLRPLGRSEYRVEMTETGGITAGTEVRVAGIPVGKVTGVTLGDGKVDVKMLIKSSVAVGDNTSMEVRMLTAVGGAFVALVPSGDKPLGAGVIPASRTSVPYSLGEVLDQAAGTAKDLDATAMRQLAVAATNDFDKAPEAIRGIISDVEQLTRILNEQQTQVRSVVSLGNEYVQELATQKEVLKSMIMRIRATLPVMVGYKDQGILAYSALAELVPYLGDILGEPYEKRFKGPLHGLMDTMSSTQTTVATMNEVIDCLKGILANLTKVAHPEGVTLDFGDQVIDDSVICIPIAGRKC